MKLATFYSTTNNRFHRPPRSGHRHRMHLTGEGSASFITWACSCGRKVGVRRAEFWGAS